MKTYLKKTITQDQIKFYLHSCKNFRFPFFDPENCYRKDGLFKALEETLYRIGEDMQKKYGRNFMAICLRGSWLRGIPLEGDDVDVLYIVDGIPPEDLRDIHEETRRRLRERSELFHMCEGKIEGGAKVEPITTLDIRSIDILMNKYMYGLDTFLRLSRMEGRDRYQDGFLGSRIVEKKSKFLKSGILIPYVGWIYGRNRKPEVFNEIGRFLPIPTKPDPIYPEAAIDETKETIRTAFIARNLIYPSMEIKKEIQLSEEDLGDFKRDAMKLYAALAPLEEIFSRAVVNYLYTVKIEQKLFGGSLTRERVETFAPNYDKLVSDILSIK